MNGEAAVDDTASLYNSSSNKIARLGSTTTTTTKKSTSVTFNGSSSGSGYLDAGNSNSSSSSSSKVEFDLGSCVGGDDTEGEVVASTAVNIDTDNNFLIRTTTEQSASHYDVKSDKTSIDTITLANGDMVNPSFNSHSYIQIDFGYFSSL